MTFGRVLICLMLHSLVCALKSDPVHSHSGCCPEIDKNAVSLDRRRVTPLNAPSLSPGFSCFSGLEAVSALNSGLNIFLLASYSQSQPAYISQSCIGYPDLPKEQKQAALGF